MKRELRTYFLGIELSSPLVLPAGVLDISFSSLKQVSESGAGIVTTKSLTLEARKGHEGPVVAEVEGGMLNAMGLCNPGISQGLEELDRLSVITSYSIHYTKLYEISVLRSSRRGAGSSPRFLISRCRSPMRIRFLKLNFARPLSRRPSA